MIAGAIYTKSVEMASIENTSESMVFNQTFNQTRDENYMREKQSISVKNESAQPLSAGAIVGIVIGTMVGFCIFCCFCIFCLKGFCSD